MAVAASTACHTISSGVPCIAMTCGRMPQAMASWRAVRSKGVMARIGQVGRNRLIMRAVVPELVQAMIAARSASTDARQAAAVMADVIRTVVGASGSRPSAARRAAVPQP